MNFEPQETLAQPDIFRAHESEIAVLSILMSFPASFDDVSDRIEPEHFADEINRDIYIEIRRQIIAGKGFDVVTLSQGLNGVVDVENLVAISQSHDYGVRGLNLHTQTLIDKLKARKLHALSSKLTELAFANAPIQDRIDCAQVEITKLQDKGDADEWIDSYAASMHHLELLEAREAGKMQGLPTGLIDLDDALDGGFYRGNLVVIGARPAMGKTALAMTISLNMAKQNCVGFMSMEMPHNDVRDRQAAILSRSSISSIKRPERGLAYDRILEGVERAKALRMYVTDKSGLNILQVRSKARALKRKHSLDVLVVDYIGLMAGLDGKQSRAYQIEEISRGLKSLAKELDIVVVCLAQVNRGVTERASQVPGLQDLRDSGAIEQDADVVGFIHRPIAANPDAGEDFKNYGLLRIAKNRQGRTTDIHLNYSGEFTLFESWAGPAPSKSTPSQPTRRGLD